MSARQAVKYGILPKKFFKMRDGLCVCAAKAAERAGLNIFSSVAKEISRRESAIIINRCFRKHGFDKQTRRIVAELSAQLA